MALNTVLNSLNDQFPIIIVLKLVNKQRFPEVQIKN